MKLLKYRRSMLILISLSLIFALGLMTSAAQEKQIRDFLQKNVPSAAQEQIKLKDKRYWVPIKSEIIKVDDIEGHIIQSGESKGIDVGSGAISISKGVFDLVKGNGTHWSYTTTKAPDGTIFTKAQGKVTTTLSPEGKPITTAEGTWSYVKGTGKYEGLQGSGTWKLKMVGEGISLMDWEGELTKK